MRVRDNKLTLIAPEIAAVERKGARGGGGGEWVGVGQGETQRGNPNDPFCFCGKPQSPGYTVPPEAEPHFELHKINPCLRTGSVDLCA